MSPGIFTILLGRHAYGLDPELETQWCRACLLTGIILGLLLSRAC